MREKKIVLTNFTRSIYSESFCLRPDNENQLYEYCAKEKPSPILTRGSGLSYSDCCLIKNGIIIDTSRLNHFLSFDKPSGIVVCQPGITFKELLTLDAEFIPPVLPGTLHATVAGGIANDIHGKNNPREQSFGHHVLWFTLLIGDKLLHCSREENSDLFYATIAGLGLTGIITRVALHLKKASRFVHVVNKPITSLSTLIEAMSTYGLNYDYQVAWLDLLHTQPRGILSLANHCSALPCPKKSVYSVPKPPFGLIKKWNMKLFNQYFFRHKKPEESLSIEEFNNPLDRVTHWNYLYGRKGLIQFQAVVQQEQALISIEHLLALIKTYQATPTLAVLKLFTNSGQGLISFCKPGFTLAIDFINNQQAKRAIGAMNQFITETNGLIYLAKDLLLNPEQYQKMYSKHQQFREVINKYHSPMRSDLSNRLMVLQ